MRGELLENKSVNVRQHHLATYLPADIWLSELRFMSIDDDRTAVMHEETSLEQSCLWDCSQMVFSST
jgi:hypothetical protein